MEKINNWLKEKCVEDSFFFPYSFFFPSILIFVFAFLMIGFRSDSIRYFFYNIVEIAFISLFITLMLGIFVQAGEKDKDKFPSFLFWAVIYFMLVLSI